MASTLWRAIMVRACITSLRQRSLEIRASPKPNFGKSKCSIVDINLGACTHRNVSIADLFSQLDKQYREHNESLSTFARCIVCSRLFGALVVCSTHAIFWSDSTLSTLSVTAPYNHHVRFLARIFFVSGTEFLACSGEYGAMDQCDAGGSK
jgi:hypothetical protein